MKKNYSVELDWHHPYYITNTMYGPIAFFWFDAHGFILKII